MPRHMPPLDARDTTLSDLEPLELVHSHMPKWLLGADPQVIAAMNASMASSRFYHGLVGKNFGELQSVEVYCGALLAAEVRREFGSSLNIHRDYLAVVHVHLIPNITLFSSVRHYLVHDEPKTLLWAALQNFSADEALANGFNPQSHIRYGGHPQQISPLEPCHFAALCRRLDLGLKYQQYLEHALGVTASGTPGPRHLATESNLRLLKTHDMAVDAHVAYLKKQISQAAYTTLLAALALPASTAQVHGVQLDGKPMVPSSLSILDTAIDGVVVFSSDTLLLHPGNRLIAYIPNDPRAPLFEFSSLQVFTDELKHRLLDPAYARFFSRFTALNVRPLFMQKVAGRPEHLALTATPLTISAAHYLCTVQLRNMFADARQLAVPTGVLDEREREERWQMYKTAGLFLVNVAALFVPVLGDLMLAVAIGEMLKEVYEGVEDWAQGDVDHAREHLLNVATDLAVNAGVVVGLGAVKAAASRLSAATRAHFEGFQPVSRDDGTTRLWNKNLQHYEHKVMGEHRYTADAQGLLSLHGRQYVDVDGKHYPVEFDSERRQWRIPHPRRADAFRPALLHNNEGAWQHAHERPLEWQDSATLLGRLGSATAALDRQTLERIRELTDTAPGVLRRMHLESLAPPSLLKVSLKRFEINQLIDTFVAQMSTDQYASRRWSELQLQLLPALPKWPAGKVLTVADDTGNRLAHYASVMWPATSHINLTSSVVEQGKLLDAVLAALSDSQVRELLGNDLPAPGALARRLALVLGSHARDNKRQVFERLYGLFNISSAAEALPIERDFPGLPRTVAQALVESASNPQLEHLRRGRVPLELAELARMHLREARINRAIEGFYLEHQANDDTERLALHYLDQLPGWPADKALEIREDSISGAMTHYWGGVQTTPPHVLVKTLRGYERYRPRGHVHLLAPGGPLPLSTAVFESLTDLERDAMGFAANTDASAFNAALAKRAANARQESAQVLRIQPIKPGFKPPITLADGQVGYPLCGMTSGEHSWELQRRVRRIYSDFEDEQVIEYLDTLVERGLEPLNILRERKRERRALLTSLQAWIDATPGEVVPTDTLYDYPENRYQAAGLIERCWRKNPAHIPWAHNEELHSLSLDGFRLGNFPDLPAIADFSHVRELKLSNMNCRDTANAFLEHFSGLVALEMDNNRMVNLPRQLERMPNLQRLSLARNLLYLNPGNLSVLNSLGKLQVLNLNDNLLGPNLSLSNLGFLRRVYLRRTWIDQWPQDLISRPFLESADLRENRIIDIPEHVYQASPTVTRNISLAGNPLSATSRLRLARYAMQGGSSMGINSEQLMSEAAAFEFWTAGITAQELRRRELLWNSLRADAASDDFFTVLSRLTSTADAHEVRQDFSRRVWEMIEAANESSSLRRDVLDIAASPRSCTDSVAFTFSEMEVQMELSGLSGAGSPQKQQLLTLGKGLFRLDRLARIAHEHFLLRLEGAGPAPDELEMHLAYRVGLARALELPGQPESMAFKSLAGVTQADLDIARLEVEKAEKTASLNIFISTRQFWREYLIRTHRTQYGALTEPYFEALSNLLKRSPEMNSERYLREVSEVRHQMDAAVDVWSLQKTEALLAPKSLEGSPSTAL